MSRKVFATRSSLQTPGHTNERNSATRFSTA